MWASLYSFVWFGIMGKNSLKFLQNNAHRSGNATTTLRQKLMEHLLCDCSKLMHKRFYILGSHYLDPPDIAGYKFSRVYKFLEFIGITRDDE